MKSRRAFLKSTAVVASSPVATQIVDAKNTDETKIFERGLEKRNKYDWGIDEWYNYIEEKGIRFGNVRKKIDMETDGVDSKTLSKQELSLYEPSNLTLTMTSYDIDSYNYYTDSYQAIEIAWSFEDSIDSINSGEPNDLVKIGYSDNHFSKASAKDGQDWVYFGNDGEYVSPASSDALTPGGVVASYNGPWLYTQNPLFGDYITTKGDKDGEDFFTVYVDPNTSVPEKDREIFFQYSMLYDSAELGGVSVGTGGVSYSITNEQNSWTVPLAYEQSDIRGGKQYNPS